MFSQHVMPYRPNRPPAPSFGDAPPEQVAWWPSVGRMWTTAIVERIAGRHRLVRRLMAVVHTDIVSHAIDAFPTRDGYQFLEFLRAAMASGPDVPSPKPVEKFLGSPPATLAFVQAPKPFPASFATDTYFAVTAFEFTNEAGQKRFGRYRIIPEAGNSYLTDQEVAGISPNYHFDEIAARGGHHQHRPDRVRSGHRQGARQGRPDRLHRPSRVSSDRRQVAHHHQGLSRRAGLPGGIITSIFGILEM